jgi:hypothetical protein
MSSDYAMDWDQLARSKPEWQFQATASVLEDDAFAYAAARASLAAAISSDDPTVSHNGD